jgi:hypothetical protein
MKPFSNHHSTNGIRAYNLKGVISMRFVCMEREGFLYCPKKEAAAFHFSLEGWPSKWKPTEDCLVELSHMMKAT